MPGARCPACPGAALHGAPHVPGPSAWQAGGPVSMVTRSHFPSPGCSQQLPGWGLQPLPCAHGRLAGMSPLYAWGGEHALPFDAFGVLPGPTSSPLCPAAAPPPQIAVVLSLLPGWRGVRGVSCPGGWVGAPRTLPPLEPSSSQRGCGTAAQPGSTTGPRGWSRSRPDAHPTCPVLWASGGADPPQAPAPVPHGLEQGEQDPGSPWGTLTPQPCSPSPHGTLAPKYSGWHGCGWQGGAGIWREPWGGGVARRKGRDNGAYSFNRFNFCRGWLRGAEPSIRFRGRGI